jgi:DNA-binding response OmpR family regulator
MNKTSDSQGWKFMNTPQWQENCSDDACRVLIVEDDADSARTLAWVSQRDGHEVQVARNGTEARVVAAAFKPQIALVDLGLPGLDGFHVVRELRKADQDLLIIVATARSSPEDIQRSREAGCDHHLVKPIDFVELAELLAQWKAAGGCAA